MFSIMNRLNETLFSGRICGGPCLMGHRRRLIKIMFVHPLVKNFRIFFAPYIQLDHTSGGKLQVHLPISDFDKKIPVNDVAAVNTSKGLLGQAFVNNAKPPADRERAAVGKMKMGNFAVGLDIDNSVEANHYPPASMPSDKEKVVILGIG